MGMGFCGYASHHLWTMQVLAGLAWGLCAAFFVLFVFCRISLISEIPPRFLLDSLAAALWATFLRVVILALPAAVAAAPLFLLNLAPCNPHQIPLSLSRVFFALPWAAIFLFELRLMATYLDHKLAISPLGPLAFSGRMAEAPLIRRVSFVTSEKVRSVMSYGGLIVRPRIVIPRDGESDPDLEAAVARELAHVRRGDSFFETIARSVPLPGLRSIGEWNSGISATFCDPARVRTLESFRKARNAGLALVGALLLFQGYLGAKEAFLYHLKFTKMNESKQWGKRGKIETVGAIGSPGKP